jgi:hypothetical protein
VTAFVERVVSAKGDMMITMASWGERGSGRQEGKRINTSRMNRTATR